MGVRGLSLFAVLALVFFALLPIAAPVSAGVTSMGIYMPGESPIVNATGVPVIIAGVIHAIDIATDIPASNVTIVGFKGATPPAAQNDTNYYSWACVNGAFSDVEYGMYLNSSSSAPSSTTYNFRVGMSASAEPGAWNLSVYLDGVLDHAGDVEVRSPDAGFALSRPDFYFSVTPFQAASVSSYSQNNQSFHVRSNNAGNVPLILEFRFEPLGQYFTITNDSTVFHVGEMRYHYIGFDAPSWSPREFTVKGTVRGEPQYLITPATVALVPAFEQEFDITVRVQRTGYTLLDFGTVAVQYVKNVPLLEFDASTSVDAYFTGQGTVTLSLEEDNITITSATVDDVGVDPANIVMTLSNTTERHLRITVKAELARQAAFTAHIVYRLTWSDAAGAHDEYFETSITVNRVPANYTEPTDINWMAIIAIVSVVAVLVGFMAYYSILKKRERAERRQKKKGRGKRDRD